MTNEYASPEDRARLAEFMGWKRGRVSTVTIMGKDISHQRWIDPDGSDVGMLPDPLNSHNDCHALIEALRADEKFVALYFGKLHRVRLYVETGKFRHESWSGDDYRTGVVTLALAVIDSE